MAPKERWTHEPAPHDYPAALDYLSLVLDESSAAEAVAALKRAPITTRKAKDLLRAARLDLLDVKDREVGKDLKKVKKGERLSPVLLLRGDRRAGRPLTVADGYHRICASYELNEDAEIPCRIADLPPPSEPPITVRRRVSNPGVRGRIGSRS